jgi:hypothetical protein
MTAITDKAKKVLDITEKKLNDKAEKVREETEKFITNCDEKKKEVEKRYNSFFHRWKWLDCIIIADLLIMPIVTAIIAYKVFIVWG